MPLYSLDELVALEEEERSQAGRVGAGAPQRLYGLDALGRLEEAQARRKERRREFFEGLGEWAEAPFRTKTELREPPAPGPSARTFKEAGWPVFEAPPIEGGPAPERLAKQKKPPEGFGAEFVPGLGGLDILPSPEEAAPPAPPPPKPPTIEQRLGLGLIAAPPGAPIVGLAEQAVRLLHPQLPSLERAKRERDEYMTRYWNRGNPDKLTPSEYMAGVDEHERRIAQVAHIQKMQTTPLWKKMGSRLGHGLARQVVGLADLFGTIDREKRGLVDEFGRQLDLEGAFALRAPQAKITAAGKPALGQTIALGAADFASAMPAFVGIAGWVGKIKRVPKIFGTIAAFVGHGALSSKEGQTVEGVIKNAAWGTVFHAIGLAKIPGIGKKAPAKIANETLRASALGSLGWTMVSLDMGQSPDSREFWTPSAEKIAHTILLPAFHLWGVGSKARMMRRMKGRQARIFAQALGLDNLKEARKAVSDAFEVLGERTPQQQQRALRAVIEYNLSLENGVAEALARTRAFVQERGRGARQALVDMITTLDPNISRKNADRIVADVARLDGFSRADRVQILRIILNMVGDGVDVHKAFAEAQKPYTIKPWHATAALRPSYFLEPEVLTTQKEIRQRPSGLTREQLRTRAGWAAGMAFPPEEAPPGVRPGIRLASEAAAIERARLQAEVLPEARRIVAEERTVSPTVLRRRMGLSREAAERAIWELEQEGTVSAPDAEGRRQVVRGGPVALRPKAGPLARVAVDTRGFRDQARQAMVRAGTDERMANDAADLFGGLLEIVSGGNPQYLKGLEVRYGGEARAVSPREVLISGHELPAVEGGRVRGGWAVDPARMTRTIQIFDSDMAPRRVMHELIHDFTNILAPDQVARLDRVYAGDTRYLDRVKALSEAERDLPGVRNRIRNELLADDVWRWMETGKLSERLKGARGILEKLREMILYTIRAVTRRGQTVHPEIQKLAESILSGERGRTFTSEKLRQAVEQADRMFGRRKPEPAPETAEAIRRMDEARARAEAEGEAKPAIERSRKRQLLNDLLDAETDAQIGEAFQSAGYRNIDGLWLHPSLPSSWIQKLSADVKQVLRDNGIVYLDAAEMGEFTGTQASIQAGNRLVRGMSLRREPGLHYTGHDHVVLHELGHHIWQQELTPEQRAQFGLSELRTEYGKRRAAGEVEGLGSAHEEEFCERFAESGGDLQKALRVAEAEGEIRPVAARPERPLPEGLEPAERPERAPERAEAPKEAPRPEVGETEAPEVSAGREGAFLPPDEHPVEYVDPRTIEVSQADVPNFKRGADPETGLVEPLEGPYDYKRTAPIIVWERLDGRRIVASGRHQLDLGRREGVAVPIQVIREADGWTRDRVMILDAELNIRDNQGTVEDYAHYFQNSKITEEDARSRGLLRDAKGYSGFHLGRNATDLLRDRWLADEITERKAVAIAEAAPQNEAVQAAVVDALDRNPRMSPEAVGALSRRLTRIRPTRPTGEVQEDIFGFDESLMRDLVAESRAAGAILKDKRIALATVKRARMMANRAEAKRILAEAGIKVDIRSPKKIEDLIERLTREVAEWEHYETRPELVAQARKRAGLEAEAPPEVALPEEAPPAPRPRPVPEERPPAVEKVPPPVEEAPPAPARPKMPDWAEKGQRVRFAEPAVAGEPGRTFDGQIIAVRPDSITVRFDDGQAMEFSAADLGRAPLAPIRKAAPKAPAVQEAPPIAEERMPAEEAPPKPTRGQELGRLMARGAGRVRKGEPTVDELRWAREVVARASPDIGDLANALDIFKRAGVEVKPDKAGKVRLTADQTAQIGGYMEAQDRSKLIKLGWTNDLIDEVFQGELKRRNDELYKAKREELRERGLTDREISKHLSDQPPPRVTFADLIAEAAKKSRKPPQVQPRERPGWALRDVDRSGVETYEHESGIYAVAGRPEGTAELLTRQYRKESGTYSYETPRRGKEFQGSLKDVMAEAERRYRYIEKKQGKPVRKPSLFEEAAKEVPFSDLVEEVTRWKGAALQADRLLERAGASKKERLAHSRETTKSELDAYLMRKFGVDEATARSASNQFERQENLEPDMGVALEEFRGESWADRALGKKERPKARAPETTEAELFRAKAPLLQAVPAATQPTLPGVAPPPAKPPKGPGKVAAKPRIAPAPIPGKKPKKLGRIVLDLSRRIGHTIHWGRPGGRGTLEAYRPGSAAVIVRFPNDLDSTAHGIAHWLKDRFGLAKEWHKPHARSPFDDELIPHFSQYGTKAKSLRLRRAEGIAEYIRAWIMNPDVTEAQAPKFTNYFRSRVPADMQEALQEFGRDVRTFVGANGHEMIMANMADRPPGRWARTATRWFGSREGFATFGDRIMERTDRSWMLKQAIERARQILGVAGFDQPARPGQRRVRSREDPMLWMRLLNGATERMDMVFEKGVPSGMDPTRLRTKHFDWIMEPLDTTTRESLRRDTEQMITYMVAERTVEKAAQLEKERVSGIGGGIFEDVAVAERRLREIRSDPALHKRVRTAAGRYRKWADSLLRFMVETDMLSQEQLDLIRKDNAHYVAMLRVMESEPGQEIVVMKRSGRTIIPQMPIHQMKGSARMIRDPMLTLRELTDRIIREGYKNKFWTTFRGMLLQHRGLHEGAVRDLQEIGYRTTVGDVNAIRIFVDGKPEYWRFNEDLTHAIRGLGQAAFRMPTPALQTMWRAITFFPRTLRAGVTWMPPFWGMNSTRDASRRSVISDFGGGPWVSLAALRKMKRYTDLMKQLGAGGAGYYMRSEIDYYRMQEKAIRKLAKDSSTIMAVGDKIGDRLRRIREGSEYASRVAEFKRAYQHAKEKFGYDDLDAYLFAAFKARDLHDMAVAGDVTSFIGQLVPFSNAAVQGFKRDLRAFGTNPGRVLMKWGTFVLAPSLIEYAWNAFSGTLDEWRQQPSYRRYLFWNLKIGDNLWLRIPKPFEIGALASGVIHGIDYAIGNKKAFEGSMGVFAKSVLPYDVETLGGPFSSIINALSNWDPFRGRHIIPPSEEGVELEGRRTGRASRLGKAVQKALGIDARKVDYLARDMFGYAGKWATILSDVGRTEEGKGPSLAMTGFAAEAPGWASRDVQWVLKAVKRRKMGSNPLEPYLDRYFEARSAAERERRAQELRKRASEIRRQWEEIGLPPLPPMPER